jgi:hypothetical protein
MRFGLKSSSRLVFVLLGRAVTSISSGDFNSSICDREQQLGERGFEVTLSGRKLLNSAAFISSRTIKVSAGVAILHEQEIFGMPLVCQLALERSVEPRTADDSRKFNNCRPQAIVTCLNLIELVPCLCPFEGYLCQSEVLSRLPQRPDGEDCRDN